MFTFASQIPISYCWARCNGVYLMFNEVPRSDLQICWMNFAALCTYTADTILSLKQYTRLHWIVPIVRFGSFALCCVPFSIGAHTRSFSLSFSSAHIPITVLQSSIILYCLFRLFWPVGKQCWFSLKFQQMVQYSALDFFFSVRFDSHCIPVEFDRRRDDVAGFFCVFDN